jgi:hypothetical protein
METNDFIEKRTEMLKLIEGYENYLMPGIKGKNHSSQEAWKRLRESISWAEDAIKVDMLLAKKKKPKK